MRGKVKSINGLGCPGVIVESLKKVKRESEVNLGLDTKRRGVLVYWPAARQHSSSLTGMGHRGRTRGRTVSRLRSRLFEWRRVMKLNPLLALESGSPQMSGLGPSGLRVIRSTARALDGMELDAYRASIREQFPPDLMKLRVEQATVHRRAGAEAAYRYLNRQAPKMEGDWTGIVPGNPMVAGIFKQYLRKEQSK